MLKIFNVIILYNKKMFGLLILALIIVFIIWCKKVSRPESSIILRTGKKMLVPSGFTTKVTLDNSLVELNSPEQDLKVFVTVQNGQNLQVAIQDNWRTLFPNLKLEIDQELKAPAPDGWDELMVIHYKKTGVKNMIGYAFAQRVENDIYILLIHGPSDTFDRFNGPIFQAWLSIEGRTKDDWTNRPINSILNQLPELDAFIHQAMQELGVPGMSLAVVEDGQIVLAKGYGLTALGSDHKVDVNTQFMIGSITKSMTTLLMASLVDDQSFSWDSRAIDLMSSFKVDDDELNGFLNMENMVGCCTGVPRKSFPIYFDPSDKSPDEKLFSMLAATKPVNGFKEAFNYSSELTRAAAYIATYKHNPKKPIFTHYMHLMQQRIFKPLNMLHTDFQPLEKNIATAHFFDNNDGQVKAVLPSHNIDIYRFGSPTGGVWSTANDMAKYLQNEINEGQNCLSISRDNLLYRRKIQINMGGDNGYALGWGISKHKGLNAVGHSGGVWGFGSNLEFYPEKRCGYVALANDDSGISILVRWKLAELWFGGGDKTSQEQLNHFVEMRQKKLHRFQTCLLQEPLWLQQFVGRYYNSELGSVNIETRLGKYILHAIDRDWELMAYNYDGQKVLHVVTPGFIFGELFPTDNGCFELREGRLKYSFVRMENAG